MLGLGDFSIAAAMLGSIVVTLVCVVYGAVNWNRGYGGDDDPGAGDRKGNDQK